jgi:MFS family permease
MTASARPRYRDALASRDFRLLVASLLTNQVGSWAYNIVLVAYVFDRTHSVTELAVLGFVKYTPGLVLSPYAGVLADRFDRRRMIFAAAIGAFAAMSLMVFVVARNGPLPLVFALSFVTAAVSTLDRPATAALTPDIVPEKDLASANALNALIENMVVVVGPAIGGLFVVIGKPAAGIQANAISFLVSALLVSRLATPSRGDVQEAGQSPFAVLTSGVRTLVALPVALTLVAFCCLDTAVYGASTVLYIPMSERFGTGTGGYAYLLAGAALGGVIMAGAVNRMAAYGRLAPVIGGGMLLLALPYAAAVLTHDRYVGFALQVVSGAGMVIVDVLAITALQRDVPKATMGRVFGVFEALIPGSVLVGSVVAAPLVNGLGLRGALLAVGFGISAVSLVTLAPVLRADRRSAEVAAALRPKVVLLEALDLFAAAGRPALERLAASIEEVSLPAKAVFIREGEPADALWVLVTGEVAVSARGEGSRSQRLRTLGPRSYVGEIGLIRELPRTATVRTLEPCTLWRIPGQDFLTAVESASASASLLTGVASRLSRSHPRLAAEEVPEPSAA